MNLWMQLTAAALVGSLSLAWLVYYGMRKSRLASVTSIMSEGIRTEDKKKMLKIEAILLSSLKLSDKYLILLRITALLIAILLISSMGPVMGSTFIILGAVIIIMKSNKLTEMKFEVDNLSHALYVISSTYGQGLTLNDTYRELREANNTQVNEWIINYLDGNHVDVPHRLVSLLEKMKVFEASGKNADGYIQSVVEQVQNKAEMTGSAIVSIREVLPIKISFYGAVPFFMILSYGQAPDVWNSWFGAVAGLIILGLFLGYNLLLKKIEGSVYALVDF